MNPHDPKDANGQAKPQMHLIPTAGMEEQAKVHRHGAERYGPWNWRDGKVCASTYVSAIFRHALAYRDGEDADKDSDCHHMGHIMANCAILLDSGKHGTLVDDRPGMKQGERSEGIPADPAAREPREWGMMTIEGWIRRAVDIINHGCEIMTPDQVSRWEGVRGVLEMAPIAESAEPTHKESLPVERNGGEPTTESTPVSSSLTLEVGKWYENRIGEKVGPIKRKSMKRSSWPFYINEDEQNEPSWTADGRIREGEENDEDLIREIQPPSAETSAFPEVGVRLRFTKFNFAFTGAKIGDEVTVSHHAPACFHVVSKQHSDVWLLHSNWRDGLEVIPEIPAGFPPVPKTPGFRKVNRGFGWKANHATFLFAGEGDEEWERDTDEAIGDKDCFYIELIPDTGEEAASEDDLIGAVAQFREDHPEPSASYPPPESERPEMPDAGECMAWERVQKEEWAKAGDIKLSTGTWRWIVLTADFIVKEATVFRAVPAPVVVNERNVDPIEEKAKEIYNSWSSNPEFRPWVEGGNSVKKYEARKLARQHFGPITEAKAKAALEDGWLWYGRGPLKVLGEEPCDDVIGWWIEDIFPRWESGVEFTGKSPNRFYAIRAGTDLARANGLEPAEPRYRELGPDEVIAEKDEWWNCARWVECYKSVGHTVGTMRRVRRLVTEPGEVTRWIVDESGEDESDAGDWVRYSDHHAAIEALTGRAEG